MNVNGWLEGLDPAVFDHLTASVLVVVLALILRMLVSQAVARHVAEPEARRRWIVSIRNWFVIVVILSLGAIWGPALRTLAVSLVALVVAFVVATKELIQCISGSVLRTAARAYTVGDRIQIEKHRGDVIDVNFFSTTILEVGPSKPFHLRTGRTIVIPNSKLLMSTVVNESYMKGLVLHVFTIPLTVHDDWESAEKILLEVAAQECRPYVEPARARMEQLEREHGLEGVPLVPRVSMTMPEAGKVSLVVRFPAPVGRQGRIEQAILRRFLKQYKPAMPESIPQSGTTDEHL
jgi:small-conductance mechanosensitive channel